jgi:hypothetical protein
MMWSSSLGRSVHMDSNKIAFAIFWMFILFYMNFGNLDRFLKIIKRINDFRKEEIMNSTRPEPAQGLTAVA